MPASPEIPSHFRVTATAGSGATVLAARGTRLSLILQVLTEDCYITFDGSTPTATNGLKVTANSSLSWGFADGPPSRAAIKAFSTGGTGVVNGVETYY